MPIDFASLSLGMQFVDGLFEPACQISRLLTDSRVLRHKLVTFAVEFSPVGLQFLAIVLIIAATLIGKVV